MKTHYIEYTFHIICDISPVLEGCSISPLTHFDHPENQNCEQKSRGSESGNIYPLLLIASLITLRLLQLEEGNLGSASSSLPTVAPGNTLGGVDLPPPQNLWDIGIVCVCACVGFGGSAACSEVPGAAGPEARLNHRSH